MSGTNPVAPWALSNYTVDDPTTYKTKLDQALAVAQRIVDCFAPKPNSPAGMSVVVDPGFVVSVAPNGQQTITEKTAQTLTIAAAPTAPNSRIDLIVVDAGSGTASVVAGTAANPGVAPALPAGKRLVAQVSVPSGTVAIGNSNITDLRAVWGPGVTGIPWSIAGGAADAITAAYTPAITNLPDGLILAFRALAANATTTPTFAPDANTAHPVTKKGGGALVAGDIPGGLAECFVRYNLANTRWELLNPATPLDSSSGIPGLTTLEANLRLSGAITPTSLSTNQNNYSPAGLATCSRVRLTATASINITGLAAQADGTRITIEASNVGGNTVTLTANDANSSPANRFLMPSNVVLVQGQTATFEYDSGNASWVQVAGVGAPSLNRAQTILGGNVLLTGAYQDIVSLSLGPGTWLLTGQAFFENSTTNDYVRSRLWDGTNVYAESGGTTIGTQGVSTPLSAIVALNATTSIRISARAVLTGNTSAIANVDGGGAGCVLTAIKVG